MGWRRLPIAISNQKGVLIPFVLAIGFFLCGLALGAISLRTLNPLVQQELNQHLTHFLKEISSSSVDSLSIKAWIKTIKMQAGPMILLWVFGLTIVGCPLILAAITARGFIVGFTVGYLVQEEAGRGLILAMAGVLPQNLFYIPAFLGAGVLALYFSFSLFRIQEAPYRRLSVYTLIFIVFFLLLLVGSWLEVYLSPGLLRLLIPFLQ